MKKKTSVMTIALAIVLFLSVFGFIGWTIYSMTNPNNRKTITTAESSSIDEDKTTLTLHATGNDITYIKQQVTSFINTDDTDNIKNQAETAKKNYNQYKGITYSYKIEDDKYIETFNIDVEKADDEALRIAGFNNIKENSEIKIELDKTISDLKNKGYSVDKKLDK